MLCMKKMALSSVLVTPAQKRPFYERSPDMVRDVLCAKSQATFLLPRFDNSTWAGVNHLNFAWPQYQRTEVLY